MFQCSVCFVSRLESLPDSNDSSLYTGDYYAKEAGDGSGYQTYLTDTLRSLASNNPNFIYHFVRSCLDQSSAKDILEVGCGFGLFNFLVAEDESYKGIDISADGVEAGRKLFGFDNLTVGDACELPPKETYDFVFATDVIEHVVDPIAFVRSLNSLLKPGGTLLFSTPNEDCFDVDNRWIGYHCSYEHLYFFGEGSLRRLFVNSGFQGADVFSIPQGPVQDSLKQWIKSFLGAFVPRYSTHHQLIGMVQKNPE